MIRLHETHRNNSKRLTVFLPTEKQPNAGRMISTRTACIIGASVAVGGAAVAVAPHALAAYGFTKSGAVQRFQGIAVSQTMSSSSGTGGSRGPSLMFVFSKLLSPKQITHAVHMAQFSNTKRNMFCIMQLHCTTTSALATAVFETHVELKTKPALCFIYSAARYMRMFNSYCR